MKRFITLLLALVLALSLGTEAFALGMGPGIDLNPEKATYDITYTAGAGKGSSYTTNPIKVDTATTLISGSGYTKEGEVFSGWLINGKVYAAGASFTGGSSGTLGSDSQYHYTAVAQYSKDGSNTETGSGELTVTYKPGNAPGTSVTRKFTAEGGFKLISNPYTYEGYKFTGWKYDATGDVYDPDKGQTFKSSSDVSFTAQWEKSSGVVVTEPGDSSSGSESSSTSSSKPASSKPSSSKPASSKPNSSKPASSSPASSVPESSSEPESVSVPESSVPETPVYEPITLGYSISGDIPVTKIEFTVEEDIGPNPQLVIAVLDAYSVTDPAAAALIASGDAIASFDISMLVDGFVYFDEVPGTLTYQLNGTQTSAPSNYDSYVLAMMHTVNIADYEGDYYITDGENTFMYTPSTDFKSAVENLVLVNEDGVNRLVIRNVEGLGSFAYQADANTVVEVNLVSSTASAASIKVSSFSPFILAQVEVGEGKTSGGLNIPFWVWIIIAVIILVVGALVALFIIGKQQTKQAEAEARRASSVSASAGITGFDDDEF